MKQARPLATGLLVLGVGLVLVSLLWPLFVRPETVWSRDQAIEQTRASAQLHKRTHERAHAEESKSEAKKQEARRLLAESQERFNRSRDALQSAQSLRTLPPRVLRWTGVVCLVIGMGIYLTVKDERRETRTVSRARSASR